MSSSPEQIREKLRAIRKKNAGEQKDAPTKSGTAMAMRVSIELIASIGVSSVIGYYADNWLGTSPIFLLLCMLFGIAAGFITIKRVNDAYAASLEAEEQSSLDK